MIKTEITISLNNFDLEQINQIAATCNTQVKLRKQTGGFPAFTDTHKQGYTGEYAFAKWLDVPFTYKPYDRLSTDVMGYQIKSTFRANGSLIKKQQNPPGIYVLATINDLCSAVTFRGWMLSQEIEQDCYWRTDVPEAAWFVPQSKLWSMSELTDTLELAAHHGF